MLLPRPDLEVLGVGHGAVEIVGVGEMVEDVGAERVGEVHVLVRAAE